MTKRRKKNLYGEKKPVHHASPACYSKVTSSKHKHAYMPELFFLVERVKMEHFV